MREIASSLRLADCCSSPRPPCNRSGATTTSSRAINAVTTGPTFDGGATIGLGTLRCPVLHVFPQPALSLGAAAKRVGEIDVRGGNSHSAVANPSRSAGPRERRPGGHFFGETTRPLASISLGDIDPRRFPQAAGQCIASIVAHHRISRGLSAPVGPRRMIGGRAQGRCRLAVPTEHSPHCILGLAIDIEGFGPGIHPSDRATVAGGLRARARLR